MPRVRIQGGSSSPFQVSATNVDTDDRFSLIFDGNQQPLRALNHGWVLTQREANDGNIAPVFFVPSGVSYSSPSGLWPLFVCQEWAAPYSGPINYPTGYRGRAPSLNNLSGQNRLTGPGGALANGIFYGLAFRRNSPAGLSYYVNVLIFRNMQ